MKRQPLLAQLRDCLSDVFGPTLGVRRLEFGALEARIHLEEYGQATVVTIAWRSPPTPGAYEATGDTFCERAVVTLLDQQRDLPSSGVRVRKVEEGRNADAPKHRDAV